MTADHDVTNLSLEIISTTNKALASQASTRQRQRRPNRAFTVIVSESRLDNSSSCVMKKLALNVGTVDRTLFLLAFFYTVADKQKQQDYRPIYWDLYVFF